MKNVTATELARNLSRILDRLAIDGEEVLIERNHRQVARLVPGPGARTALDAMADLHRTLPESAAQGWADGTRGALGAETPEAGAKDPWAS